MAAWLFWVALKKDDDIHSRALVQYSGRDTKIDDPIGT